MLTQLVANQQGYLTERRVQDRENRFRIQRTIPKISADRPDELLKEYEEFEKAFRRTQPRTGKEWGQAFEESLIGMAAEWRDFVILYSPGKEIYEAALSYNASDVDWVNYYRYMRVS